TDFKPSERGGGEQPLTQMYVPPAGTEMHLSAGGAQGTEMHVAPGGVQGTEMHVAPSRVGHEAKLLVAPRRPADQTDTLILALQGFEKAGAFRLVAKEVAEAAYQALRDAASIPASTTAKFGAPDSPRVRAQASELQKLVAAHRKDTESLPTEKAR